MFADPLVVIEDNSGTQATKSFARISLQGNSAQYIKADAVGGDPRVVKISHTQVGKGASLRDRHLMRIEAQGVIDSIVRPDVIGAIYVVADLPVSGFTSAQKIALARYMSGLFRNSGGTAAGFTPSFDTYFTKWINGES